MSTFPNLWQSSYAHSSTPRLCAIQILRYLCEFVSTHCYYNACLPSGCSCRTISAYDFSPRGHPYLTLPSSTDSELCRPRTGWYVGIGGIFLTFYLIKIMFTHILMYDKVSNILGQMSDIFHILLLPHTSHAHTYMHLLTVNNLKSLDLHCVEPKSVGQMVTHLTSFIFFQTQTYTH